MSSGFQLPFGGLVLVVGLVTANSCRAAAPRPVAELPLDEKKELDRLRHCIWLGFSPDGNWLAARHAATDAADRIQVWARDGWKSYYWHIRDHSGLLGRNKGCTFDADSSTLYAMASHWLYTGSLLPTGRPAATNVMALEGDRDVTHAAMLAPDGKALLVWSGSARMGRGWPRLAESAWCGSGPSRTWPANSRPAATVELGIRRGVQATH